jgi:hypothetical protein
MRDDVCVQDGGAVWNAMISLEDAIEEDGGSNFCGMCVGVR